MTDFSRDLTDHFHLAMSHHLEAYAMLPDGRSVKWSKEDERVIDVFDALIGSLDAIPSSAIQTIETIRAAAPGKFEKLLRRRLDGVRCELSPTNASEFVELLRRDLCVR